MRKKRTYLTVLPALMAALCLAAPPWCVAQSAGETRTAPTPALAEEPADAATPQTAEAEAPAGAASEEAVVTETKTPPGLDRNAVVVFGQNVELKRGETAEVVVVIGGSAKIYGKVREGVVVIGGDADIEGDVGEQVVAVMGSIHIGPKAVVHQDVVSVGGRLDVAPGAKVEGHTQEVAIAGLRLPRADWVNNWVQQCVLMLRPLSPHVGWVWFVALVYFVLFLLIAAVFRHPVQACVDELENRPATTFLVGLLTKLLLPLLILILIVIVVGIVVVPFLAAGLFVLGLVGKVAVLEWVGFRVGRLSKKEPLQKPVAALIVGAAVLAVLYMIPVIGLLTMLLLSAWSLGCAITAAFGGFRRELPDRHPAVAASTPTVPAPVVTAAASPTPPPPSTPVEPPPPPPPPPEPPSAPSAAGTATAEPPVMPETLTYPKATFWERMAAGFLDLVLLIILGSVVQGAPLALIVAVAYFSGLWAWRGTSIGGIVLGLKVVRTDGEPVSFIVALVRALAAGFSAFVLFLGFFWIAWDPEKQGWHDKIAGTVVLKLPRGTPLVCF